FDVLLRHYNVERLAGLFSLALERGLFLRLQSVERLAGSPRLRPQRRIGLADEIEAQRRLVADHDAVDVAVAPGPRDGALDLPFVTFPVGIDPDAERDLEPELGGNRGYQLAAARRGVCTDGVGIGTENLQVGANLFRCRLVAVIRMLRSRVRRVRD